MGALVNRPLLTSLFCFLSPLHDDVLGSAICILNFLLPFLVSYLTGSKLQCIVFLFNIQLKIYLSREAGFHILITSYQLLVSDEKYFRRVKWQYMVLDEAQAIKSSNRFELHHWIYSIVWLKWILCIKQDMCSYCLYSFSHRLLVCRLCSHKNKTE